MNLGLIWHKAHRFILTVRHLRLKQVTYQIWYRLYSGKKPREKLLALRQLQNLHRCIDKPRSWEPSRSFTFLNEQRDYSGSVKWEDKGAGKLWLYNLHYFDFLNAKQNAEYTAHCSALIDEWVISNTDIDGNGWESYPCSLRIVNWIKYSLQTRALSESALISLAQQAQWLSTRLEHHILANHLFTNAKALLFAGLFFQGKEADVLLATGLSLFDAELKEQVLGDGAHYELSPLYHSIILEDVLDVLNMARAAGSVVPDDSQARWTNKAQRMMAWQQQMLHPDGKIAFFNDAAFAVAADPEKLHRYATSLGIAAPETLAYQAIKSVYLPESGYAVLRNSSFTAIADIAAVGPGYQPGHAHADTLSCELSFGSERVFVNSGTSTYAKGKLRGWQRSTAAHNTLLLNDENSSDVWAGFRVARRAYPGNITFDDSKSVVVLSALHNGYRHLVGAPSHSRRWQLSSELFEVIDTVDGQFDSATVHWLLHPHIEVLDGNCLQTATGEKLYWSVDGGSVDIVSAVWYPEFGLEQSTSKIVVKANRSAPVRVVFRLSIKE